MADNKKYYYLKLKENFFDSEEMIILENMQDGYLYSNILLKLYLRSLKSEGRLMYKDIIPYTPQVLASIVRHPVGVVEKALDIFQRLGLIDRLDSGAIYMMDIQNFIGQSSTEADRIRDYRRRIEAEKKTIELEASEDCVTNVRTNVMTNDVQMNVQKYTITRDRDKDKVRDRDRGTSADAEPRPSVPYDKVKDLYNSICKSLPACKSLSDARKKAIKARFNSGRTLADFEEVFRKTEASSFLTGGNDRNWQANFDWLIKDANMAKVLDGNYDERPERKPRGKGYRYKSTEGPRDFSFTEAISEVPPDIWKTLTEEQRKDWIDNYHGQSWPMEE